MIYDRSVLQINPSADSTAIARGHETLIADTRDDQRPSEFVQNKFIRSLPDSSIPVSSLHTYRRCSR